MRVTNVRFSGPVVLEVTYILTKSQKDVTPFYSINN